MEDQKRLTRLVDFMTSRLGRTLILVVVALFFTVQLVTAQRLGIGGSGPGFTSDDVSIQTIVSEWQRGMHGNTSVGDDNWFIKYPLYAVTNSLAIAPELKVFITTWILTIATVVGSILVLWLVAAERPTDSKKRRLTLLLLPVALIISLSPYALYVMSRISTRNIEIPLLLLLFYALIAYDRRPFKRPVAVAIGAIALTGLLLANDPMFRFMAAFLVLTVYALRGLFVGGAWRRTLNVLGVVVLGIVASTIFKVILVHIVPLNFVVHAQQLSSYAAVSNNLNTLLSFDIILFNAGFWGATFKLTTALALMNAGILVLSLGTSWRLLRYGLANAKSQTASIAVGLFPFWVIAIVLFASSNADIRYLILLPFAIALAVVLAVAKNLVGQRFVIILTSLLFISALANLVPSLHRLATIHQDQGNVEDKAVAQVLEQNHLTKGMATYWRASTASYFSGYSADIANMNCDNQAQTIHFDPLLSNPAILDKPSNTFFILYYPTPNGGFTECTSSTITHVLGRPQRVISVPTSEGGKIAVYSGSAAKIITGER